MPVDPVATRMVRSISKPTEPRSNSEMNAVGWVIAAGVAFLFLPLLPFAALVWVVYRVLGGGSSG